MRNAILALRVGDRLVEGMTEVRHVMFNFSSNHFKEPLLDYPHLNGIDFSYLLEEDNVVLSASFLIFEIDQAVSLCDSNNNHGFDGFNFSFFRRF